MKRFLVIVVILLALGGAYFYMQKAKLMPMPAVKTAVAPVTAPTPAAPVEQPPSTTADTAATAVPEAAEKANEKAAVTTPVAPVVETGPPIRPEFSLINTKGEMVTEKSLPAKYKLIFFGFTHCPDICPAALEKISSVMESYDSKGEKVVPVFITVDPARDTKEAMAAYLANYNPNIIGLTGTEPQIMAVESNFKVFASADKEGQVNHSGYIYLVSPDNKLLEVIDSSDKSAEDIIDKIKLHEKG